MSVAACICSSQPLPSAPGLLYRPIPFPMESSSKTRTDADANFCPLMALALVSNLPHYKKSLKKGVLLGGRAPRFFLRGELAIFGGRCFGSFLARLLPFSACRNWRCRKQPEPCVQQPEPSMQTTVSELMGVRLLLDGAIGATTPFYQQKPLCKDWRGLFGKPPERHPLCVREE